jgi:hypothetical protein
MGAEPRRDYNGEHIFILMMMVRPVERLIDTWKTTSLKRLDTTLAFEQNRGRLLRTCG